MTQLANVIRVDETLRILQARGHADQTANIRSWAIRQGWRPTQAADLEALAKKIWSLKNKPGLSRIYDPRDRYQCWTDEAAAKP